MICQYYKQKSNFFKNCIKKVPYCFTHLVTPKVVPFKVGMVSNCGLVLEEESMCVVYTVVFVVSLTCRAS